MIKLQPVMIHTLALVPVFFIEDKIFYLTEYGVSYAYLELF